MSKLQSGVNEFSANIDVEIPAEPLPINVREESVDVQPEEVQQSPQQGESSDSQKRDKPSVAFKEGRTDISNSRRFIAKLGRNVRYCHPWRTWLVWDGVQWKPDSDNSIRLLAKGISDDVWAEARESGGDAELKFAANTATARSVSAILSLSECEVPISPSDMDSCPWLLNVLNGTVDLRTGELRKHCREDYLTKLCPIEFHPEAVSPIWDGFLESIFSGNDDIVNFVRRLLGYSLSADIREQVLAIFWGDGSNGKSTLLNAFMQTLGPDYTMQAIPEFLMIKRNESHPTERADLMGKRFVSAVETDKGCQLSEAGVKSMTGGDPVRARYCKKDFFQFDPTHKVVLSTNHRPRITGRDHGIWRRLALVPFTAKFWDPDKGEIGPEHLKCDKLLDKKLKTEREGILASLVRGCLEWQQDRLNMPAEVRAATDAYRQESDSMAKFIEGCCVLSDGAWTKTSDIREAYREFCKDQGKAPVDGTEFTDSLKEHGCVPKARNAGRGWSKIGIIKDS